MINPAIARSALAILGASGTAQAVAEHEDALRIDAVVRAEQRHRAKRVVDDLFADGDILDSRRALRVLVRPLLVAEHGDAAVGQAPREIAERMVRANRFVAIVRAGAVDEDDRADHPSRRHRQRRRQFPFVGSNVDAFLGEPARGRRRRRLLLRRRPRHDPQSTDFAVAVEGHHHVGRAFLELTAEDHGGDRALRPDVLLGAGAESAELLLHGAPHRGELRGRQRRRHLGIELVRDLFELVVCETIDDSLRMFDGGVLLRTRGDASTN